MLQLCQDNVLNRRMSYGHNRKFQESYTLLPNIRIENEQSKSNRCHI